MPLRETSSGESSQEWMTEGEGGEGLQAPGHPILRKGGLVLEKSQTHGHQQVEVCDSLVSSCPVTVAQDAASAQWFTRHLRST